MCLCHDEIYLPQWADCVSSYQPLQSLALMFPFEKTLPAEGERTVLLTYSWMSYCLSASNWNSSQRFIRLLLTWVSSPKFFPVELSEVYCVKSLLYVTYTFAAASDISVVVALCFYLYKARTGSKRWDRLFLFWFRWGPCPIFLFRTDSMVTVIMIYVINTGLLSTISQLANLITVRTLYRVFSKLMSRFGSLQQCLATSYISEFTWSLPSVRPQASYIWSLLTKTSQCTATHYSHP